MRKLARGMAGLVALVALAALLLQYALLLRVGDAGAGSLTVRFLSYFTILSNLLVAAVATHAAIGMPANMQPWLVRARTRGAAALYIGVTGIVYVAILRHLWQPQGAQWWADSGLHYATPLLYVAWWLFATRHGGLHWRDLSRWLLFPGLYLLWCLLRGTWAHEYPYPFIDVDALGLPVVLRNAAGVLALFVVAGVLLVAIDRMMAKRSAGRTQ